MVHKRRNRDFIKSKKVEYNGLYFDSSLELQFALLIEGSCEYIYRPLTVWYDPNDSDKLGKQECNNKYIPDFLVRKVRKKTAHLIEIKFSQQVNNHLVQAKKIAAEKYIKSKGYDWEYKIITEKDFNLKGEQAEKYKRVIESRSFHANKQRLLRLEAMYQNKLLRRNSIPIDRYFNFSDRDHSLFVRKGLLKEYQFLNIEP